MNLKAKLSQVWQEIDLCLEKSGRRREDIHLIAVSKTRPVEAIQELFCQGQVDFGENKPQEIRDKSRLLSPSIRWHMIGHLQANKIKYVVGKCALIHSLDSLKLARQIEQFAEKAGIQVEVLLQVDLARDGQKQGFLDRDLEMAIEEISSYPHMRIRGLMTIGCLVENPEENRGLFQALKKISVDIQRKNYDNVDMSFLSMGMTNDYKIAIEEGATHIRLGTAIFGERNYK